MKETSSIYLTVINTKQMNTKPQVTVFMATESIIFFIFFTDVTNDVTNDVTKPQKMDT